MWLCSEKHEEICHEGTLCPLCAILEEKEELENERDELQNERDELQGERDELRSLVKSVESERDDFQRKVHSLENEITL